jgi:hypothetical protein
MDTNDLPRAGSSFEVVKQHQRINSNLSIASDLSCVSHISSISNTSLQSSESLQEKDLINMMKTKGVDSEKSRFKWKRRDGTYIPLFELEDRACRYKIHPIKCFECDASQNSIDEMFYFFRRAGIILCKEHHQDYLMYYERKAFISLSDLWLQKDILTLCTSGNDFARDRIVKMPEDVLKGDCEIKKKFLELRDLYGTYGMNGETSGEASQNKSSGLGFVYGASDNEFRQSHMNYISVKEFNQTICNRANALIREVNIYNRSGQRNIDKKKYQQGNYSLLKQTLTHGSTLSIGSNRSVMSGFSTGSEGSTGSDGQGSMRNSHASSELSILSNISDLKSDESFSADHSSSGNLAHNTEASRSNAHSLENLKEEGQEDSMRTSCEYPPHLNEIQQNSKSGYIESSMTQTPRKKGFFASIKQTLKRNDSVKSNFSTHTISSSETYAKDEANIKREINSESDVRSTISRKGSLTVKNSFEKIFFKAKHQDTLN